MLTSTNRPLQPLILAALATFAACGSSATTTTTPVAAVATTGGSGARTVATTGSTTADTTALATDGTADTESTPAITETASSVEIDASSAVLLRPVLQCFVAPSATGDTTEGSAAATTAVSFDATDSELLAAPDGETCQVGPPVGDGTLFRPDAETIIANGEWTVKVGLRSDAGGEGVWNALAAHCFAGDPTCPTKRLAIEVDGAIVSAPTVNSPEFTGDVQISGNFSKVQAEAIAAALNQGASG